MPAFSIGATLTAALCHPALQAAAVFLATFVLEDAATVIVAMQAQIGALSISLALGALYAGIVLGDLGLYGLGALAARLPVAARLLPPQRREVISSWLAGRIFRVVLISRFLPGVRFSAYTTCGYLRADLAQFALATALGTTVWTTGLFALSWRIGALLAAHFAEWRWVCAAGVITSMMVTGRLLHGRLRAQPMADDD
jgi:membrane protein DedA with SNARE-associated domain